MRFTPFSYVRLFRLSSFTGQLYLSARLACRFTPTFQTSPPLLFAQKLAMQSSRSVTNSGEGDFGVTDREHVLSTIPTVTTEDTGPPLEKRSTLAVSERTLRTPSPLLTASCDDDSEAESFLDGRTEEVDRDTRGRAFAWCRDFLSGSWKTLTESDFQISIVR